MSSENWRVRAKGLAWNAPIYCFMYFAGPVIWQLWLALRLGFLSMEESRRCLLSPATISIAGVLFAINMANLSRRRLGIDAGEAGNAPRGMAVHCASLLAFATIGTAASMSALAVSETGGLLRSQRMIVGSLNGASMCFAFYAASTASAVARLSPPGKPGGEGERRLLARIRTFNAGLFAIGLPLFIATSMTAARLSSLASDTGKSRLLLVSMAVPVAMGGVLFFRADRRLVLLQGAARKKTGL
jgi:hypothetical protein